MSRLRFELEWDPKTPVDDPDEATKGRISAFIEDRPVWSAPEGGGLHWSWIDLLEWLSDSWPYLEHELSLPPAVPGDAVVWKLRAIFEYDATASHFGPELGQSVFDFRERHDLSSGVPGAIVPPLLVWREGSEAWVASKPASRKLAWTEVHDSLVALGDAISERLAGVSDERARIARDDWNRRDELEPLEFAAIATSMSPDRVRRLVGNDDVVAFFELPRDRGAQTELLAAARLAGPLTHPDALTDLVEQVRGVESVDAKKLGTLLDLGTRARAHLDTQPGHFADYQQGYVAAQWLRRRVDCDNAQRFDIEGFLAKLCVPIRSLEGVDPVLEALLVWGEAHGPAILLNPEGTATQGREGRRASLAHELAHLLLDRDELLPLVEVLEARDDAERERRARAFAAELLAPQSAVGPAFLASGDPQETLGELCGRYDVSREIVAWQARNSGVELSRAAFEFLRQQVSEPERFTWRAAVAYA